MLEILLVPMDGLSDGLGSRGFGHEMSAERLLEQKGRIFSYRYHCRAKSKPFGKISVGWSPRSG